MAGHLAVGERAGKEGVAAHRANAAPTHFTDDVPTEARIYPKDFGPVEVK